MIAIDLSNLLPPATPHAFRHSKPIFKGEASVVAVVDRSAVLALVEQLEAESPLVNENLTDEQKKQLALTAAHDENILSWSEAIAL